MCLDFVDEDDAGFVEVFGERAFGLHLHCEVGHYLEDGREAVGHFGEFERLAAGVDEEGVIQIVERDAEFRVFIESFQYSLEFIYPAADGVGMSCLSAGA